MLAGASTAFAGPAGAPLGPATDVGVVPNGDLSAGLEGWGVVGPASSMVLGPGPILSAADNVTVISPVIALPVDAQVVPVSVGAPGANTVVVVRARPADGGADVELTTIVPARGVTGFDVPVGQFAGRSIRLVFDPTMSIGRRMVIGGIGPVRSLLPGWSVSGGSSVVRAWGRTALKIDGERAALVTPVMPAPAPARYLGVALRGSGVVTARAGATTIRATATEDAWTWAYAPLPAGRTAGALSLTVEPAAGASLVLGPVATPARATRIRTIRRSGPVIAATVDPWARGLRAVLRVSNRTVARGRVGAAGGLTLHASAPGRAILVLQGDATRTGASRPVAAG